MGHRRVFVSPENLSALNERKLRFNALSCKLNHWRYSLVYITIIYRPIMTQAFSYTGGSLRPCHALMSRIRLISSRDVREIRTRRFLQINVVFKRARRFDSTFSFYPSTRSKYFKKLVPNQKNTKLIVHNLKIINTICFISWLSSINSSRYVVSCFICK